MATAEYGANLSLREAAEFAGVSEPTMRQWVKEVPNVTRNQYGAYSIPRNEFMEYISAKAHRKQGASSGRGEILGGKSLGEISGTVSLEAHQVTLAAISRAEDEVKFLRERVKELEGLLGQANRDFSSIMREFMDVMHHGPRAGLSAWTHKARDFEAKNAAPEVETKKFAKAPLRVQKKKTVAQMKPAKKKMKVAKPQKPSRKK